MRRAGLSFKIKAMETRARRRPDCPPGRWPSRSCRSGWGLASTAWRILRLRSVVSRAAIERIRLRRRRIAATRLAADQTGERNHRQRDTAHDGSPWLERPYWNTDVEKGRTRPTTSLSNGSDLKPSSVRTAVYQDVTCAEVLRQSPLDAADSAASGVFIGWPVRPD